MSPRFQQFDYILRTNLSSFYVFSRLQKFLQTLPKKKCYCGVPVNCGRCFFVSGAGFIISTDMAEKLVKNQKVILKKYGHIYDDVAIGLYFHQQKVLVHPAKRMDFTTWQMWMTQKNNISSDTYHFRLKNQNENLRLSLEPLIFQKLLDIFY
jgi:hypothetical protein